ncbi:TPA: hypothetical protein ACX6PX_000475 [Photobacterium damselae]
MNRIIVIIYSIFVFYNISAKAGVEHSLNFKINAHIDSQVLDYGIRSLTFSPNILSSIYDKKIGGFPDITTEVDVVSNIESIRQGNFFYNIKIVNKESHCLDYSNGNIPYESPKVYLEGNNGLIEITENPTNDFLLTDSSGDYKKDSRIVTMKFSSIPNDVFIGGIKKCAGEITFSVGLSI